MSLSKKNEIIAPTCAKLATHVRFCFSFSTSVFIVWHFIETWAFAIWLARKKANQIEIKQFEQMKHLLSTWCSMVVSFYGKRNFCLVCCASMRWKTFLIFILCACICTFALEFSSFFSASLFFWLRCAIIVLSICVRSR